MTRRTISRLLLPAVLIGALSLGGPPPAEAAERVTVGTIYLTHPVGDIRRITIEGELGGQGQVRLDNNRCGLNLFGDTTICSETAVVPRPVEIQQLKVRDPSGAGRRVYRLVGDLAPENTRYYLTVPRGAVGNYRLAVVSPEGAVRVLSLEELHGAHDAGSGGNSEVLRPPPPPPPTSRESRLGQAAYAAVRRGSEVTIRALGQHATAGFLVVIEQVSGAGEPPEFRLLEYPPIGEPQPTRTPFDVKHTFESGARFRYIHVKDAKGRHRVPVQQARGPR